MKAIWKNIWYWVKLIIVLAIAIPVLDPIYSYLKKSIVGLVTAASPINTFSPFESLVILLLIYIAWMVGQRPGDRSKR